MYCTGGIRCERGSAYLKAKVSHQPWGPAGVAEKTTSPTACVDLSTPTFVPSLTSRPLGRYFPPSMFPA